ncbi:hypothetical protein O181_090049 [Austropuccinia psidii MF-1]|uniref:OTU domain-containing protein n=1 Tax=Austropuccinia psidii MF-1 TaxID=1389203 RepID=A0A9Q3IUP4_9BASI|nr:hypothetical protein [Austropuccinia psidii MF-1]
MIERQFKRRGRPPSKVTRTASRSQAFSPSPITEVDSSEDSEPSLSKSISPSDSLPSATEVKEYGKSGSTLIRSQRLELGNKVSQRKSHKPAKRLRIYDTTYLTFEHCQINYNTSVEFSKLFVPGSKDFTKFILKYNFKPIIFQGDGNCGYRTVSHYIYKTQDHWADVRDDRAE